jgi:hypothetical protein
MGERASYGAVDRELAGRMAGTPPEEDGPVWMVNLMRYRQQAAYADGRDATMSGREADDRYRPVDVLAAIGAAPVLFADVDAQLLGDSPRWDRVGVVRYPTRRSFIEMQSRDDFRARHVHKAAGMAETIVAACRPLPSPADDLDRTLPEWADVPHPPTAEDGPVEVLHLLRFHPGLLTTEMAAYTQDAIEVAVPHGGRVAGWFEVEGTVVGDGRQWDQARFNAFPSMAAFMAVVADPARLEAQRSHREVAIADTYTLVLRAELDVLAESRSW